MKKVTSYVSLPTGRGELLLLVVTVPLPGDDLGVEDGVDEQSEEAEGQPPPVEEALPEDEEHGGGLEQHEAAQPRHRGVEGPG